MCSLALLEAHAKHSDDCYWNWVTNDTPYRLIRGDEAFVYWRHIYFISLLAREPRVVEVRMNDETTLGTRRTLGQAYLMEDVYRGSF